MKLWRLETRTKFFLFIGLILVIIACTPPAGDLPATEGTLPTEGQRTDLIIATAANTQSLDPTMNASRNQMAVMIFRSVYQTLVAYDPAQPTQVIPDLAESWEFNDDHTSVTFRLKEGATFFNGNPVAAEDVVSSFNRLKESELANLAETIDAIEAIDGLTVNLVLNRADPALLSKLALSPFSIIDDTVIETYPDTPEQWAVEGGSGPYMLEEWQRDESIRLTTNSQYTDDPQRFTKVIIRYMSEAEAQAVALAVGEIDVAMQLPTASVAELQTTENVQIAIEPTYSQLFLDINPDNEIGQLANRERFQEAVRYALDYDAIAAALNNFPRSSSFVPAGFPETPNNEINRDLDRARSRLEESGYQGEELKLTYLGSSSLPYAQLAEIIGQNLQDVGIQTEPNPVDVTRYFNEPHALQLSTFGPTYFQANQYLDFLPGGSLASRPNYQWQNDEAAALRIDALRSFNSDERQVTFAKAQELLDQAGPYVFLAAPTTMLGYNAAFVRYSYHPAYGTYISKLYINCDECKTKAITLGYCPRSCRWFCGGC